MSLSRSEWIPRELADTSPGTTIGELLRSAALAEPDRLALVDGAASSCRRWTYAELLAEVTTVARVLRSLCSPGDRLAICGPSTPEWVVVELAAALAGVVVVGVNPAMTRAEISYVVKQSGAVVAAVVPEYRGIEQLAVFEELRAEGSKLTSVLNLDEALSWSQTVACSTEELPEVSPSDTAFIQYTSGTTGAPKGAILTHDGVTRNTRLALDRFAVTPGCTWLNVVPMYHLTGSVATTLGALWSRGAQAVAPWDAANALKLIEREQVGIALLVPTMLLAMMEREDFDETDLSSMQLIVSGGTVVLPELVMRAERRFKCDFGVVFGQTEAGAFITTTHRTDSVEGRTLRVGNALPCFEVRVVDPHTGDIVPCESIGEFWLRGPSVMKGYHDQPDETASTVTEDGWLRTGDLGFMDDRGYIQVTGKLKDVIIRGGVNVYPREIENRLTAHPDVADVSVVGVPDERLGEQVAAFVRVLPGRTVDTDELAAFARETLAAYKVPRVWRLVDKFPVTASGKIQKFRLRADFEAGMYDATEVGP